MYNTKSLKIERVCVYVYLSELGLEQYIMNKIIKNYNRVIYQKPGCQ